MNSLRLLAKVGIVTIAVLLAMPGWAAPRLVRTQRPNLQLPQPLTDADFYERDEKKEELGRLLFHDKELSGNRNISCATCHHVFTGTADSLSLGIGEGGHGLSIIRTTGTGLEAVPERVPRNAPAVFNLGARQFTRMFHDGRVAIDPTQPSGFASPAGADLPLGLDNPLAAQAMFPVTSTTEMAGQRGEGLIGTAAADGNLAGEYGVWDLLARRLQEIDGYFELFAEAFPEIQVAEQITYVHAANAIAAFEAGVWRADDSPFDRYLRGDKAAMSLKAIRGMKLFYGRAACSTCHAGALQTDHEFHAIGVPQFGPGKGDNATPDYTDGHDDFGREQVTGDPDDRYRFRTPTLRNVYLTGPWGHDGAYSDLEAMVRHHLAPAKSLHRYDPAQAMLPYMEDMDEEDWKVMNDPARVALIESAIEIEIPSLRDREVEAILAFLDALTERRLLELWRDLPTEVPSELPVYD